MSTPSTITALHPQNHFYPHYPDYSSSGSSQRQSNLSLPRPSKLAHHAYTTNAPSPPVDRQLPPLHSHKPPQSSTLSNERQSSSMAQSRGKKKADWRDFYKNGLPKEIIVIDDSSPEPSGKRTNQQPDTKRRKMENTYDTMQNGQHGTAKKDYLYDEANSSGTNSSGRNTSTLYSTAPTSLTSTSSAGHHLQHLGEVRVGQKRKRVSRPAQDEESPELEVVGHNQAWTNYMPPPKPPIKAGEVYTPVVRDV